MSDNSAFALAVRRLTEDFVNNLEEYSVALLKTIAAEERVTARINELLEDNTDNDEKRNNKKVI